MMPAGTLTVLFQLLVHVLAGIRRNEQLISPRMEAFIISSPVCNLGTAILCTAVHLRQGCWLCSRCPQVRSVVLVGASCCVESRTLVYSIPRRALVAYRPTAPLCLRACSS